MRESGGLRGEELVSRVRKMQQEERWERIGDSGYNRWYGRIKGEGLPGYLKKGGAESRRRRVARFRLGNEMRGVGTGKIERRGDVGYVEGERRHGSMCGRSAWSGGGAW